MELAHRELFEKKISGLITTGILTRTRHPMYFGTILAYLGGIIGTLSLITLIPWFLSVILYYKMATYEEQKLEEKYGQAYLDYQKKVPKWIPR
jgi:protein-S-isoprenylcysteine O-methyltransferase Ste14